MPSFVYLGDLAECVNLGFTFRAGVPTEVNDERAIRKLRAHSHFSEVFDGVEVMSAEPKKRGRLPKAK